MLVNIGRARNLGCDDPDNLERMRRGASPIARKGAFIGQQISIDHVLPRAKYPELDNVLANLELMPIQMNEEKSASMGKRQIEMETYVRAAGFLDGSATPSAASPATKSSPPVKSPTATPSAQAFMASSRSEVFHKLTCRSAAKIVESNRVFYATREDAIADKKRPCSVCNP